MSKPRVIIVGHFFGEGETAKKLPFLRSLVEKTSRLNLELLIVENSGIDPFVTEFKDICISCREYAVRFPFKTLALAKGLIHLTGLFLTGTNDLVELISRDLSYTSKQRRANKIKSMAQFISGWGSMSKLVREISLSQSDTLVTWGEVPTLHRILRGQATKVGAKKVIAEFGELQECFFLSECGIFAEAWPTNEGEYFKSLKLDKKNKKLSKNLREFFRLNKISNKKYSSDLEDLSEWINERKVIFVPGLFSLGAGMTPRWSKLRKRNSPIFSGNAELLADVTKIASQNNWVVLYKDHPNTIEYMPHAMIKGGGDYLKVLGSVDIYDVLLLSDVVVSLASKSVFLSLYCNIPVVLAAPFSLTGHNLVHEIDDASMLEDAICEALEATVNTEKLDDFNGRLLQYYLYSLANDDQWFPRGPEDAAKDLIEYVKGNRIKISSDI